MAEVLMVLVDNGMPSQNQDYLPSRYILQKETVESLITRKLEENQENVIGIAPVAQYELNDIITPTKVRAHLNTFLNKIDLYENTDVLGALRQAMAALMQREATDKVLLLMLGSKLSEDVRNELFARIYEILTYGVFVKIAFFGENAAYGNEFSQAISFSNYSYVCITPEVDFSMAALNMISGSNSFEEDDPELAEAIRLSLQQK